MAISLNRAGGWIVAAALALVAALSIRKCNMNKEDADELKGMLDASHDTTKYYQNKLGEEVATRRAVEGSIDNMRYFFAEDMRRELEERFDMKFKDLRAYVSATNYTRDTIWQAGEAKIVYKDSSAQCPEVSYMLQRFMNPYYDVDVRVGQGAYASLQAWDTLRLAVKDTAIGGWFNRKHYSVVNLQNANPHVRSTIQGAFLVKQQERRNQFDLSARGGWRYFKGYPDLSTPFAGAEASYRTGRLSFMGSYNKLIGGGDHYFLELSSKFSLLKF